jgi:hypothetical protein
MNRPMRGLTRMSYSEALRLVGAYADRNDMTEIRVLETDEGLILQGLVMSGARAGERETYQLTADDLQTLWRDAWAQRGRKI